MAGLVIYLQLRKRKNIRLKNFDYSKNGAYFITICLKERHNLLWEHVGATCGRPTNSSSVDNLPLSDIGKIIESEINKIESCYDNVFVDNYVIMPNHLHFIIKLNYTQSRQSQLTPTISRIIQQFKGSASKQIGFSIWQKLFHDHVIRNEEEYLKIFEYIDNNPFNWENDCYYEIEKR